MAAATDFPMDRAAPATMADVARELHDAWLDVATAHHAERTLRIEGHRDRPVPGRRFHVGRYPVAVELTGVNAFEFDDPHELGGVGLEDLLAAPGSITLTSNRVGCLTIRGDQLEATLELASRPSAQRRRFSRRWRT